MGTADIKLQEADKDELESALESLETGKKGEEEEVKPGEGEKTAEEIAAEAALAERLKPQEMEENGMKRMETPDEAKVRVETEDAEKAAAAAKPTETEQLREEVKDLRQIARTSKKDQVQLQAKLDRLEKRKPVEAKVEGEEELDEDGKPIEKKPPEEEPLSRVEELQQGILQVGAAKGANLDVLLETMGQSETYKDILDVCSRSNFDDIFESIASEVTKDDPTKNMDEVLLEIELSVWNKPNPYKYMYDLVKTYHPTYAGKETVAKPGEKVVKEVKVVDAPGTIADKGADADLKVGWTKERIDELPEEDLGQVPAETYEKYMQGELK